MKSDFNSLVNQTNDYLYNAQELMVAGKLDEAFKISEKIAENIQKLKIADEQNQNIEMLKTRLAQFQRNLNNRMVKVVKSGLNNSSPKASLN